MRAEISTFSFPVSSELGDEWSLMDVAGDVKEEAG
jgi:hypothetical protein